MRICVYAISKNEEKFVERFCEAATDADLILVADTGSTDMTVPMLGDIRERKGIPIVVHQITIKPWRFDLARNAAMALIPANFDVCVSLDLDEELQPGWREEIERVWKLGETTRLRYKFDWGVGIVFYYEKIHARIGYRWHHPCHEYPVPYGINEVYAQSDMLLVVHKPDNTKSRGQYLPLLKMSIEEDPTDPRNAFYYARELSFSKQWETSIAECRRYLALPRANWPNERCYAYRVIGRCYNEMGKPAEAATAFLQAAMEAPETREPWFELAALMYRQHRWAESLAFALRCLAIANRELVYTVDPEVWGAQPHDYAAIAAYHLGIRKIAVEHARKAVELNPHNPRYMDNLRFCEGLLHTPTARPLDAPVPNIVHFVWFTGPASRTFSYINYLAVALAAKVQKPERILMYYNEEPVDNLNWTMMKQIATLVKVDIPKEFDGVKWGRYPHYWSDLVRLQKLEEMGGIYLDTDSLLLKPLNEFMGHDCVLAGGIPPDGFRNQNPCVSAATIIARPHAPFIQHWLEGFAVAVGTTEWSGAVTDFPLTLNEKYPGEMTLVPMKTFLPFDWTNDSALDAERADEFRTLVKDSYVAHMWDTMWSDRMATIDPAFFVARFGDR